VTVPNRTRGCELAIESRSRKRLMHEADLGDVYLIVRFRGEADVHARVARVASISRSAEEVAQFGRSLFRNFLWKEMTGLERPATDIGCPGSP
jgi:hypothetical protein